MKMKKILVTILLLATFAINPLSDDDYPKITKDISDYRN